MDIFFLVIYLFFPVFILVLMRKSGISLLKVNIPSFVTVSMFAFAYMGTLPLYFGWNDYRYETGVQDELLVFKVLLFTSWTIFSLVVGFVYARHVVGLSSSRSGGRPFRALQRGELFFLSIVAIFCCFVLYVYLVKVPEVALFVAFKEGGRDAMHARSLMGNDFVGKYHRYSLFLHDFLNLVTFSFFAHWVVVRKRGAFFVFFITFLLSAFTAVMATEKAPFIWLTIGLFLVYVLVVLDGRLPLYSLMKLGLLLVAPLVLFYMYFMGSKTPFDALRSILSRTFTGGVQSAYHHLEFFPLQQGFLMGRSFPNPAGILPFEPYSLSVEVMKWRFPAAENGVVASSPAVFWCEAYANYGLFGVMFLPFVVGVGLYCIDHFIFRLENTPLKIGLVVWMVLHYRSLAVTGVSSFVLDFRMFFVVGLVLFIIVLSNYGKVGFLN